MFTADYARKLITATEVLLDLGKSDTICIDDLPKHESQLRELAKAEPKQRALIWGESLADNDGKPPTAEQLRAKLEALRTIAPAAVAKAEKQMAEKIRKRCEQLARPEASKEEEAKKREQRDARANEHRQIFVRWKVSLGYSDKEIIDEVLDTLKHYRLVEKG
jgi:chemotaxis response regulator CheB